MIASRAQRASPPVRVSCTIENNPGTDDGNARKYEYMIFISVEGDTCLHKVNDDR